MSAHDVRRMGVCKTCGQLANVIVDGRHPRCIPMNELLKLPVEDLRRIRMNDLPDSSLRKVLDVLSRKESR